LAGSDIFISYSRQDRGSAQQFATALLQEGFVVWWDDAIHSGDTFDEVIEEELRSAKAVVVLWSPRSVASRWVRAEATIADRRRKLVPTIIESCDRPIIFELTHTVDLSHWDGDKSDPMWQVFVKDLRRLTGRADEPQLQPQPPVQVRQGSAVPLNSTQTQPDPVATSADVDDDEEEYNPTQAATPMGAEEFAAYSQVHCLEMTQADTRMKRFMIDPGGARIGRTVPSEIILADPRISRTHCKVELVAGTLRVTDLNSTNGTYVDGARVAGDAVLPVGSTLTIGEFTLVYQIRTRAEV
jgi:hypothetical protein